MAIKINGTTVINDSRAGNLTSADIAGNLTTGNVSGTTGTFTSVIGTLLTTAQPNITSVGQLSSLGVTGNVTTGNVSGTTGTFTNVVGTLSTTAQPNITSVGNLSSLTVTGNVTAGNFSTVGEVTAGGITLLGNTISSGGTTMTLDPSAPGATGLVVIAGNLQVNGTTTTIDSTTITINDLVFTVANNAASGAAANGGGLEVGPAGSPYATWTYDNTFSRWTTSLGINASGNITAGNLSATNVSGTLSTAAQPNITSVGTLGSLTVTGNIAGGNLSGTNIAGTLTTAAQTNITSVGTLGSLTVTGNVSTGNVSGTTGTFTNIAGTLTTAAQTNITSVGTLGSLTVTGNITGGNLSVSTGTVTLGNIVNANGNGVGNIGSSSLYFNTVFAKATSAQYADLAEMYEADGHIEPGTVVAFGGAKEVTTCGEDGSRRVAGVVSTNPSYIMNAGLAGDNVVAVALTGRVPTKVTGTIRKGDMLVAAGGGRARAETNPAVGAVIGKALADFDGIEGVIEVVVGRL